MNWNDKTVGEIADLVMAGNWRRTDYYADEGGEEYPQETVDDYALKSLVEQAVRKAVAMEREGCAVAARNAFLRGCSGEEIAAAVRNRGKA